LVRREFFRRVLSPSHYIFPPFYEKRDDFINCLECESKDCISACYNEIIELKDNYPTLNFQKGGCDYCGDCANACNRGVLDINKKREIEAQFLINPKKCLAWANTICYSCADVCESNSIKYKGLLNPVIDDTCTKCGHCVSVCPTDAIEILRS